MFHDDNETWKRETTEGTEYQIRKASGHLQKKILQLLRILEADTLKQTEMKEKKEEYTRRIRTFLKTKFCWKNLPSLVRHS